MSLSLNFSNWFPWSQRGQFDAGTCPGIYAIALSTENLAGTAFTWRSEIVYIGMSIAKQGLKGRLRRFHNTIAMVHSQHGGAERFLYAHRDYEEIANQLFVAMFHISCSPAKSLPDDLRKMGEVAKAEFDALAEYYQLPQFNDKAKSPKFKFQKKPHELIEPMA